MDERIILIQKSQQDKGNRRGRKLLFLAIISFYALFIRAKTESKTERNATCDGRSQTL